MNSKRFFLVLGFILVNACFFAKPKVLDSKGQLVFRYESVRHPAGDPYFCFNWIEQSGEDRTYCEPYQPWCGRTLQEFRSQGLTITSGCKEVDTVYCFYLQVDLLDKTECFSSSKECMEVSSSAIKSYSSGKENVSDCVKLDKNFQPKE